MPVPRSLLVPMFAVLSFAAAPTAGAQADRFMLDSVETRVWFEARASMGRFNGTARRVSGWAEAGSLPGFAGGRGEITVDAASFGTGVALRNRHLRGELETERYPTIRFVVDRVERAEMQMRSGEPVLVTLHGRLTIRDVTREVAIPAQVRRHDAGFAVDGSLATKFTDWGMQPPSQMGGLARVRDDLTLRFHAVFRRE